MSEKHWIWSYDYGTIDDWKDSIRECLMVYDDDYNDEKEQNADAAWEEKVSKDPDYYDNMLVKDYKAARKDFLDNYSSELSVDEYIEKNESKCYDYIAETNMQYLDDERMNLSEVVPEGRIVIFGHLGLWNGSPFLAAVPDDLKSVSDCLKSTYQKRGNTDNEYYIEDGDFQCDEHHHDGTNHYIFRAFPANMDDDKIEDILYKAKETNDLSVIYENTESLAPGICKVYGWDYEPNEYDVIQPEQGNGRK